jgi:diguanylate cyclase (GGDEF)-like protein/PAS domain S-box-containing protein
MLEVLQSSGLMPDSDDLYRDIVERQTELICRYLPDGVLTFVNAAFCRHFNLQREALDEQNFFSLWGEQQRVTLQKSLLELSPKSPERTLEHSIPTPDSKTIWQHWTILGIFDEHGLLVEVQSTGINITERKLAELAATKHARELGGLHKATAALLSTLDLEALLGQILDAAISAVPAAKRGVIHLIARDTGQLEMRAVLGYTETDPRIKKFSLPSGKGYVARAVGERQPLLIPDIHFDDEPDLPPERHSKGNGVQSAIVAPLIMGEHVLGALSLESSSRAAFTESDLDLAVSFAATATAAIRNAQLHAEVQKQAITDTLTGIYNRRGFFELGRREVERALRFGRPLAAIMLDVDNFKRVNDNFGHQEGDRALQHLSDCLNNNIRKVDILGRYGGDEFSILLPEIDMFAASTVAERLRHSVFSMPIEIDKGSIQMTISLGIAKVSSDTPDLDTLLDRADQAMYAAKNAGRNRIEIR